MADSDPIPPLPPVTPSWWKRNWHFIALAVSWIGWLVTAIANYQSGKPLPPPPTPIPIEEQARGMGWVNDPEAVDQVVAGLRFKVFGATPAGQVAAVPDFAYQWDMAKQALGHHVPTRDQGSVGSCVAFGSCCAVEYQQCVQIVESLKAGQPPPKFFDLAQEVTYGLSRIQIGGGKIRGDGSVGAWAADAWKQYGGCQRGEISGVDLTSYNETRCRQYGDKGPPAAILPECKKHLVHDITPVKTTAELRQALANRYSVSVASDVGFGNHSPYKRDADGVLAQSGSWSHQMCFLGYTKHPARGWLYYVMNSWGGTWVSGPTGPGDPPPGGFWVLDSVAAKMLKANDSWAYSQVDGFEVRNLPDWFVARPPRRAETFELSLALAP